MRRYFFVLVISFALFALPGAHTLAATLKLSPDTGVYSVGQTFTARVVVNTAGKAINAAEGALTYNPKELQVTGVSKTSSIFNLWTIEPTYSGGKVSFGGGSPSGYSGGSGTVITITFKTLLESTPKVSFGSGSVLAADGQGTDVLSAMNGGTYTVSAAASTPEPEYVAPANTPAAPSVTSVTHPDPLKWYQSTTAELAWSIPANVTAVRTLVDQTKGTIPTVVYDTPITKKEITDLSGVSYFHIQFKNKDGWGKVAHYRLAVDADRPESVSIALEDGTPESPRKKLILGGIDPGSGIQYYMIQLDGGERIRFDSQGTSTRYELASLRPGDHTVVVEAFDYAGNSLVSSYSFVVDAFEAPTFTDYPERIQKNVIPVLKGKTRPKANVRISMARLGSVVSTVEAISSSHDVVADEQGVFIFIPDGRLDLGVYEVVAQATDSTGSESRTSDAIRLVVEEPGYVRIGNYVIGALSVIIPLVALVLLLGLVVMYGYYRAKRFRTELRKEVGEAEKSLAREFESIISDLRTRVADLKDSKGKLTKSESTLLTVIAREIESAEHKVKKEIDDIERLVKK